MTDRDLAAQADRSAFDEARVPPDTRAVTDRLRRTGAASPSLSLAHIEELRRSPPGSDGVLRSEPRSKLAVERTVETGQGPLRIRVLAAGVARARYVHLHGGGWVAGGADRQDQTLVAFGRAAGLAIASVDYRLAPEHPHPAAVRDCVAAVRWVATHGQPELGSGPLIVGGESAGAHLAALTLIALRDRGEVGLVAAANLAFGVYDVSMTPSARRWGKQRIVINTPDLAFFAEQYAPAARRRDPDVSPLYADLACLPPALFSCGTLDPLLDDTLFMAARWQAAGNQAELALYRGAPHEFLNLRERIGAEQAARERMVRFIDTVLAG